MKSGARPKKKVHPRRVCVVGAKTARKILERGGVDISYRCRSRDQNHEHGHIPYAEAVRMIRLKELEWVGEHHRIATWPEEKVWAKTRSGTVHTMQLLALHKVLARRKRS